ncbi:MAG: GT4 family glycosyltransferase PelF [Planctomycetota bacterium]
MGVERLLPWRRTAPAPPPKPAPAKADVCLVLEGTYPFVMGGVSGWIHGLVRRLPHLRFHLWYIAANQEAAAEEPVYDLPANVTGMTVVSLEEAADMPRPEPELLEAWVQSFDRWFGLFTGDEPADFATVVRDMAQRGLGPIATDALIADERVWNRLMALYNQEAGQESLLHYFWTCVNSLRPLITLLGTPIPSAGCYHTISTGYAGLLAARAHYATGKPTLVTEHGIYTKERRIEINQAEWIPDRPTARPRPDRDLPYFRGWWNRVFAGMSKAIYDAADQILTIHHGNTAMQIRDGADPRRMHVIPNGIHVAPIEQAMQQAPPRPAGAPFTVGFIGRIAPIKDVITLIDATAVARQWIPDLKVRVMGPSSEDPEYLESCLEHARDLGLDSVLEFEGPVRILDVLPQIDVLILTSVSEAQPLVILEAYAARLPVISTDVGAASEMVNGRAGPDAALGSAGLITPIGSPVAIAQAMRRLAENPELRREMGAIGHTRALRFYREQRVVDAYGRIYAQALGLEDRD